MTKLRPHQLKLFDTAVYKEVFETEPATVSIQPSKQLHYKSFKMEYHSVSKELIFVPNRLS